MRNIVFVATAGLLVSAAAASAQPSQGPSASSAEKVDGFVCPVINTENVLNSPKGITISGGDYSIAGPHGLRVPINATNQDGAGDPAGEHASPGDEDYSAIWNVC